MIPDLSNVVVNPDYQEPLTARTRSLYEANNEMAGPRDLKPSVPVLLDGEPVSLSRVNEYPKPLYMTPSLYQSQQVLAAFTDIKAMNEVARSAAGDEELHQVMNLRPSSDLCADDAIELPVIVMFFDEPDFGGENLNLSHDHSIMDLGTLPRRGVLNWANAIRSIYVCAYPYTIASGPNLTGDQFMWNFRCTQAHLAAFDLRVRSVVNWGLNYPWC